MALPSTESGENDGRRGMFPADADEASSICHYHYDRIFGVLDPEESRVNSGNVIL